jgi:2-polyprenyl-6-methoxyphenol hydroxylase-like FAD-dependent oxidoreductase
MLRAEEDFWNVVLLARDGLQVPETDEDFTGFTSPLADGRLSKALQAARPASPIHHYGRTANRLRHIDQLPFWPRGLAILGDSVMTLDPYFGLGMTNAARGAVLLARHLDENAGEPFDGARFQKDLASLNEKPWKLATRCTTDGTPLAFDHDRLARLYGAAPTNPDIARSILEVQHLLRDEDDLLKGMAA